MLGAIALGEQVLSDGMWVVMIAGAARAWFVPPRRLESVGATGGLMSVGVGAGVAVSGSD
ncbi:hypothetical protein ACIBG0_35865 [Nocardia sp. NPDC050630]|uniref:hypothetical protein n=1 Tax=Nocardia sp. NPDC050630 TaxID=3364321 RepID=UPI0037A0C42F